VFVPFLFVKPVFSGGDGDPPTAIHLDEDHVSERTDTSSLLTSASSCSSFDEDLSSDESCVDEASQAQLCDLLGPSVREDEEMRNATSISHESLPSNLQDTTVFDLPVGFYRLRRAFLSSKSDFWTESVLNKALKYEE